MRTITITELLEYSGRNTNINEQNPYDLYMSIMLGYGIYVDRSGERLSLQNIHEMAEQLGNYTCINHGYTCVLVNKLREQEVPAEFAWETHIGVNVRTRALYDLVYKITQHFPPEKYKYMFEIPIATVIPIQMLITILEEDAAKEDLSSKILSLLKDIPTEDALPNIEGLSDGPIIPNLDKALDHFRKNILKKILGIQ